MRLKMRCDCTGDPPGELTTTATVGSFDRAKAFSIGPATEASASPGRSGVTTPIGPVNRSTGTTGPRLKNSIGIVPGDWEASLPSRQIVVTDHMCSEPPNSRLCRRPAHIQPRTVPQNRLDLRPEAVIGVMQD